MQIKNSKFNNIKKNLITMWAFLLVILAVLPIVISGQSIDYSTLRYAEEHHRKRLELFRREPIVKGNVIFLGDSLIEFARWNELLDDPGITNRGIAGDNTFGVLARLDDVITREPSRLFIEVGINDISQNIPTEVIVSNFRTLISRVKAGSPKTEIYVFSILPTNDDVKDKYPDAYNKNAQVISVNKELKMTAKNEGASYVDLNKKVRDKFGKLDKKFARPDGLHLNRVGYDVWAGLLKTKKYL